MPEPNKKIEDLLKRHVARRKAESDNDFELHPATRNLLQGEVARTFSKSKEAKSKSLLFALWPRLAIIGGFTALLIATVFVLNQPAPQRLKLAQSKSREIASPQPESRMVGQAKPASDTVAEKSVLMKREVPASPTSSVRRTASEAKPAGQSAVADGQVRLENKYEFAARPANQSLELPAKKLSERKISTNAISASGIEPHFETAATATLNDAAIQNRSRFVQQDLRAKYRQNFLSPALPKILQSFEFVQTGNEIRLLDFDGSVYEGELTTGGQKERTLAKGKPKDESANNTLEENSTLEFRVTGMNQQLHQIVTFTGELAETPGKSKVTSSNAVNASGNQIFGKVSIGGTNEFEIQAVEK